MNFIIDNKPLLESLVWFIVGAVSHRFLCMISGYLPLHNYALRINERALKLVGCIMEELVFIHSVKYKILKENGASDNALE